MNSQGTRPEQLHQKSQQLLHGSLKHARSAALAAMLVPLAAVALSPAVASAQGTGGTGGSCTLTLSKECRVPPPAPPPFVCSSAKPLDSVSMTWNGEQAIHLRAWKGAVGSVLLYDSTAGPPAGPISPGQEVTVAGYAGSPNDVVWEILDESGTWMGDSTFHLSCSDADMNGPEDCGKAAGNGKGLTGFINDWVFEGMAGNGLVLDCHPPDPQPTSECTLTPGPNPSCQTFGKPTSLTFRYNGNTCANPDNNNPQSGKYTCTGTIDPTAAVTVAATTSTFLGTNTKYTLSPATVQPGQEFTVSASGFDAQSYFTVSNGGGTENVSIHTSCSQPLEVGHVFGSLTLVAFNGQRAPNQVTYRYQATLAVDGDLGSNAASVTLQDDDGIEVFNPELRSGDTDGDQMLGLGEVWTYEATRTITQTTTNNASIGGMVNVTACTPGAASATVTVNVPCAQAGGLSVGGRELQWTLDNPNATGLEMKRITIAWPAGNGYLDEVKRGGDRIHKGNFPAPAAIIESGWDGQADRRSIAPGTNVLKFKFQRNASVLTGAYQVQVEFTNGCTVQPP